MSPMCVQLQPLDGCVHTEGDPGPAATHSWGSSSKHANPRPALRIPVEPRWEHPGEPEGRDTRNRDPGGHGTIRWRRWPCLEHSRVAQAGDPPTHTPYSGVAVSLDAVSCDLLVSKKGYSCGVRVGAGSVCDLGHRWLLGVPQATPHSP